MKNLHLSALLVAVSLTACGGGGGDDGVAADTPAGNSGAAAERYVGTWNMGCTPSPYTNASGVSLSKTTQVTFTAMSGTTLGTRVVETVYAEAGCTGTAVALPSRASGNTVVIDGTATVDGRAADKVTFTELPIDPGFSAGISITLNGVVVPGDYFTASDKYKALMSLSGNQLHFGGETLDADGYPTTLNLETSFTRQ